MKKTILLSIVFALTLNAFTQKNPKLAPSPPMGWNSWNWHGKEAINEQIVMETIDAIVNEGLKDKGYVYVVVDGGWRDTTLGPNGELLPHPLKFPNGMKALAAYAHSKGLKFGLHLVPGTHDCRGDAVGSYGKEEIHLQQFMDWGLDFIKLDLCKMNADPCKDCAKTRNGWSEQTVKEVYTRWSGLLNKSGSNILFSISAYEFRDWYPDYCNMARTTGDIRARIHPGGAYFNEESKENKPWSSVMAIAERNNLSASRAGNGYWNDPDMMVTGEHGLSKAEQETHFALWAIMSSPLFLGNDPRAMTAEEKALVMNEELIAVNQDPSEQGELYFNDGTQQIWIKDLNQNRKAILFINLGSNPQEVTLKLKDAGIKSKVSARDIINKKDIGFYKKQISFKLSTNECRMVIVK